jgi:G patch domain-containing protein 1
MNHIDYIKQQRKTDEKRDSAGGKFVRFGTPLFEGEDENTLGLKDNKMMRYQPDHKQIATDERGRRRFHGAFEGGFSAGYFNSVGSREGWVPKNYSKDHKQSLDDIMDEEDKIQILGANRFREKEEFQQSFTTKSQSRNKADDAHLRALFGGPSHAEEEDDGIYLGHVLPNQNKFALKERKISIGVQLLMKMGWKEGDGIGPRIQRKKQAQQQKVYGAALPPHLQRNEEGTEEVAPQDTPTQEFVLKNNTFGLGYTSQQIEATPTNEQSNVMKVRDIFHTEQEDMSNYDIALTNEDEVIEKPKSTPIKHAKTNGTPSLRGFTMIGQLVISMKKFPPPEVPKEYIPMHVFEPTTEESSIIDQRVQLNLSSSETRGKLLGETPLPGAEQASFWDYLKPEDRMRIQAIAKQTENRPQLKEETQHTADLKKRLSSVMANRFTVGKEQDLITKKDQPKEVGLRYVEPKAPEPKQVPHVIQPIEFSKHKAIPKSGKLVREEIEWHPEPLLSRRFQLLNPYPKSLKSGTQNREHSKKTTSIFDDALFNDENAPKKEIDHAEALAQVERPSMDIFRAVFEGTETKTLEQVEKPNYLSVETNIPMDTVDEEDDAFPFGSIAKKPEQRVESAPVIVPLSLTNKILAQTVRTAPVYTINEPPRVKHESSEKHSEKEELKKQIESLKQMLGNVSSDEDRKERKRKKKEKKHRKKSRGSDDERDHKRKRRDDDDREHRHKKKHKVTL